MSTRVSTRVSRQPCLSRPKAFGTASSDSQAWDGDGSKLMKAFMGYVAGFFHQPGRRAVRRQLPGAAATMRLGASAARNWLHSTSRPRSSPAATALMPSTQLRRFHNYFVTHLPQSSLHPDSRSSSGPHHKLPRSASTPHTPGPGAAPAVSPPNMPSRDLTVVRIPLHSAKHHFGAFVSRGQRPYNEDTYQAGTIDMPAFARRAPISLVRSARSQQTRSGEGTPADSTFGDPQIFYFGVFDGHGGSECSEFLRDELPGYVEEAAVEFELSSSLRNRKAGRKDGGETVAEIASQDLLDGASAEGRKALQDVNMKSGDEVKDEMRLPERLQGSVVNQPAQMPPFEGAEPVPAKTAESKAIRLQRELVDEYKDLVGGYFRRFRPQHFTLPPRNQSASAPAPEKPITLETVLSYAFLRADLDFVSAQARKPDPDDPYVSDFPLNRDEVLGSPHLPPSGHGIGGPTRFKGGSTGSVALISTPTASPFWHPAAHSTIMVAHVGDTRILLCETATGLARPLTDNHHPSSPGESNRLRRYANSMVTDSFGEERISGLANSRSFGDMQGKRIGVSAEPQTARVEVGPAQFSFLALLSDGVSGALGDQEIVDVVKEAKTPEQGARDVVNYATEVSSTGDNATCLVIRLGGWERRSEGGLGSLGTKEIREMRKAEAQDPRRGRR